MQVPQLYQFVPGRNNGGHIGGQNFLPLIQLVLELSVSYFLFPRVFFSMSTV